MAAEFRQSRNVRFTDATPLLLMATVAMLASPSRAAASPVTITGGFTSFNGLTSGTVPSCLPGFGATINGVTVNAPVCNGGQVGSQFIWGPASYAFPSTTSSVAFYETAFGSNPAHNALSFTPGPVQDVVAGQPFRLGTISITNGIWFGAEATNSFHMELTTVSDDPALSGHVLSDDLIWYITSNISTNTPEDNADSIYFSQFKAAGVLWAYEADVPGKSNTTTADLYGRIGSLTPTSFLNAQGGFVTPDLDPTPAATAVPEPASMVLMGGGIVLIAMRRRTNESTPGAAR
jgi:hypothetical protein